MAASKIAMNHLAVEDYLEMYPANAGDRGTHTTMNGKPAPGKFTIPQKFIRHFVDAVYDSIFNQGKSWSLTEGHPQGGSKLVIDIDLRFATKDLEMENDRPVSEPLYSAADLIAIARKYQELIVELYPEVSEEKLECCVFQRRQGGYLHAKNHQIWKDGFHLVFPEVVLTYPVAHWIRSRVVQWIQEMKDTHPDTFLPGVINTPDDIVDASVVEKNQWLMYGTNKPGLQPYAWTARIHALKTETETEEDGVEDGVEVIQDDRAEGVVSKEDYRRLSLMLSGEPWQTAHLPLEIRDYGKRVSVVEKVNHLLERQEPNTLVEPIGVSSGDMEGVPGTYAETLALVANGKVDTGEPSTEDCLLRPANVISPIRRANQMLVQPNSSNPEFVRGLLRLLKPSRAYAYQDWFVVGAALYHEKEDDDEFYELWREWSSQASNYDEGSCQKMWYDTLRRHTSSNPATIGTIRKMAREDNSKDYLELIDEFKEKDEFFALVRDGCMSMTEQDFARILHFMCESEFAFTEGEWFQYMGHRWMPFPKKRGGHTDTTLLRKKIGGDLLQFYMAYMIFLNNKTWKARQEARDGESDSFWELTKLVSKVINKLKTSAMKKHIIEEAEVMFLKSGFTDKLDMNPYLLGFENGILDLKTGRFRHGHHSDMVSMSVGYDYSPEVNEGVREEIMKMLESIQPNREIRDFLLTFFASTLIGTNKNEVFVNLEGTGGNGKGVWTTLHDSALGEYAGTLNNNYLVNVSSSPESHNTMLAANYKKRYLQVNEPPNTHGKRLSTNFIKELTGGDKIQLRMAHSAETKTVEPMFKLCMLFNEFPTLENPYDGGFMRRFVGIHFPNKFLKDGEPKRPNEFKSDPTLKEKIKTNLEWKQQYMLILLDYLKQYREAGETLAIPSSIQQRTRELLSGQDPVDEFMREELVATGSRADIVSRKDLYAGFQEYVKVNYMGQKVSMRVGQFQDRLLATLPAEVEFRSRYTVSVDGIRKMHYNVFFGLQWKTDLSETVGGEEEE